jgi:hypothetical protein
VHSTFAHIITFLQPQNEGGDNCTDNHHNFDVNTNAPRGDLVPPEKQQLLFKEIEKLMKNFQTHRCA